ncbi:MAG: hypothetical protein ABI668_11815 [Sphingorhabdus sp.]
MSIIFAMAALMSSGDPALVTTNSPDAPATTESSTEVKTQDVYTKCFFDELSAIEKTDVLNGVVSFKKKNANKALMKCQKSKQLLVAEVDQKLISDPKYSDHKLRAVAVQNEVAIKELTILLVIYKFGK